MKKLIAAMLAAFLLAGCAQSAEQTVILDPDYHQEDPALVHHAEIVIRDMGVIRAELDEGAAPVTVKNFISLAESGFYDGLTIHRAVRDFMIQGGDPTGTGTGGADEKIKGEFAANGVDNPLSHLKGTLSMARRPLDPDSGSSQFFIMTADDTSLDGQYAAFGRVTEGIEIAERITQEIEPVDGSGMIRPDERPVIETVRIID